MRTQALVGLVLGLGRENMFIEAANALRRLDPGAAPPSPQYERPQFNVYLVIPLAIGALIVAAMFWVGLCYRRNRQKPRDLLVESPSSLQDLSRSGAYESYDERSQRSEGWHTLSIEMNTNPFGIHETFRVPPRNYEVSTILPILLECPELMGKRVPAQSLHFKATLSSGASGEVWLAQFGNQQVAVKQLFRTNEHTLKDVTEFVDEIVLSASLRHPHIVSFIGVAWSSLDNVGMVMEYCPMGDLRRFLAESGRLLSWSRDKIRMAVGITRALQCMHSREPPIIHRDLKSKNILLTETLQTKIIDFGVSRSQKDGFMTAGVGTPYWIAPEILEGKRYTEQADIYSFGVVLSELDTCKMPFSDVVTDEGKKPKPFQVLHWVLDGSLSPSFSEECPRWIRSVGMQCLQHDPDLRPTAAELTHMLRADARRRVYTL